jgi:cobalamin biosynthetic protein CobC
LRGGRFSALTEAEMDTAITRHIPSPEAAADHGGGIDAACARWGGSREDWIDLSTGINPRPFPLPPIDPSAWATLPDAAAERALQDAARRFWTVPDDAAILAAPGTSALIARLPALAAAGTVRIPGPTYNEHARAFAAQGWRVSDLGSDAQVLVNPNNPDGRTWRAADVDAPLAIVDESFADLDPTISLVALAARPGVVVLKGLGKFWGLAGVRLGFAIGDSALVDHLARLLGPWPVSGPALAIGTAAFADLAWVSATRARLAEDAVRLDRLLTGAGARSVGGTMLYRLVAVPDATAWQDHLARHHIWTRRFPYSQTWLRLGLPGSENAWKRLAMALGTIR